MILFLGNTDPQIKRGIFIIKNYFNFEGKRKTSGNYVCQSPGSVKRSELEEMPKVAGKLLLNKQTEMKACPEEKAAAQAQWSLWCGLLTSPWVCQLIHSSQSQPCSHPARSYGLWKGAGHGVFVFVPHRHTGERIYTWGNSGYCNSA